MDKLFVGILMASFLIGILAVIPGNVIAETWSIETVDSTGDVGSSTSMALDSYGYPHISYFDFTNKDLKYAKWTGSAWSIETVDSAGDVGQSTSMALGSYGYPHISYFDYTNKDLKYAKWTGSAWSIETVDSADNVGRDMSMALDSNGYPHISYSDITNEDLKYAKWSGNAWSIETVDSADNVGWDTSMTLDSYGYPHISYEDNTNSDIKYAKWTGSAWSIETVDSADNVGGDISIALASNGYPHISYYDFINYDLKYAKLMPKVPTQPENPRATAGDSYVYLSWDAPGDDGGTPVTGYKIYRGTTSRGEKTLLTTVGNVLTYTDKNVTNNQTYYYDVSAVNSVGEGIRKSNEVSATPEKKYEWGLIIALIAAATGIAGVIINYLISRKRRYGSISATSCPDDAIVFLDGGDKGESPVTFDKTKKGTHIVLFSKPGYYDCEKRVVVNADQITAVHCDLKKMEMKLRLSSEPTEIPADGK